MVDFQLPEDIIIQVKKHALKEAPRECCGIILVKKGKRRYIPCTNISTLENHFIIDPAEFIRYSLQGDVEYIVHSHTTGAEASEHDVQVTNQLKIPYLIFYIETDSYEIIVHDGFKKLIGREYIFEEQDCFEAARDWYMVHGIITPPRRKWLDNWWEHGYNYISDEVKDWPFEKVTDLKYGDLMTLSVAGTVPNHIAVYLSNDIIFHHAVNRLSCRENMYPMWAENIYGIYRHEKSGPRGIPRREIWT